MKKPPRFSRSGFAIFCSGESVRQVCVRSFVPKLKNSAVCAILSENQSPQENAENTKPEPLIDADAR